MNFPTQAERRLEWGAHLKKYLIRARLRFLLLSAISHNQASLKTHLLLHARPSWLSGQHQMGLLPEHADQGCASISFPLVESAGINTCAFSSVVPTIL